MSRFASLFEDEDVVFPASIKSKIFDVTFNANNDVARYELEEVIERMLKVLIFFTGELCLLKVHR